MFQKKARSFHFGPITYIAIIVYYNSDKAILGVWFACANKETEAC